MDFESEGFGAGAMKKSELEQLCLALLDVVNTLAFSKPGDLGWDVCVEIGQEICHAYYNDQSDNYVVDKVRHEIHNLN